MVLMVHLRLMLLIDPDGPLGPINPGCSNTTTLYLLFYDLCNFLISSDK